MRTHAHARVHRRRAVLMALPAALLLVTGCRPDGSTGAAGSPATPTVATPDGNGIAELSGAQILERASEASRAASSVRLRGTFRDDGKPFVMDLRIAGKRAATGSMTIGKQRLRLIRMGSTAYIQGDDAFLRSVGGQDAVRVLHGKYFKMSADNKEFNYVLSFTLPSKLFAEVLRAQGTVTKGGRTRVGGRPAIALHDGGGGTVYVATEGAPQILRVRTGVKGESLDFLDYGKKFKVQRPPSGLVIDAG